jgi:hypothetical protein
MSLADQAINCSWVKSGRMAIKELMKTYVKYPPRKLQSETYTGPITISQYERFQHFREMFAKEGFHIGMPVGN